MGTTSVGVAVETAVVGVSEGTTVAGILEGTITAGVLVDPGWVTPPGVVGAHADNKETIKTIMKSCFVFIGQSFCELLYDYDGQHTIKPYHGLMVCCLISVWPYLITLLVVIGDRNVTGQNYSMASLTCC